MDDDYPYEGRGGDGQLEFSIEVEPVSLQARPTARRAFDLVLARALSEFEFLVGRLHLISSTSRSRQT